VNAVAAERAQRLLLAITPSEFDEFLPGPLAATAHQLFPDTTTLDPRSVDRAAWPAELRRRAPGVLPPALDYVCHLGGSGRALVARRHLEQGLRVTNWGGFVARTVAEGTLALMLASLRGIPPRTRRLQTERGRRREGDRVQSLFERRVGVHGFGLVARELVRLLAPLGCAVTVFAPAVPERRERGTCRWFASRRWPNRAALVRVFPLL
jgi:phosphoglycerate dehydrogenase-like enzyme